MSVFIFGGNGHNKKKKMWSIVLAHFKLIQFFCPMVVGNYPFVCLFCLFCLFCREFLCSKDVEEPVEWKTSEHFPRWF